MSTMIRPLTVTVLAVLMAPGFPTLSPPELVAQQAPRAGAPPAWLGISYDVRWFQQDGQCEPRVVVESVVQGSPAERAGLRRGDMILTVDGQPAPAARLRSLSIQLAPGDPVRLRVARGADVSEVTAVADRRPNRLVAPTPPVRAEKAYPASAPVVRLSGDTLVAWNLDSGTPWDGGAVGYWFSHGDGQTEFRRLRSWSGDELDRRVSDLLVCAEQDQWEHMAPASVWARSNEVHERAESLRVVIASRAAEAARDWDVFRARPAPAPAPAQAPAPLREPRVVQIQPGGVVGEGHSLEVGLRAVAGAEVMALEPELAEYFRGARRGILVLRVSDGSPAHRAGLQPGDVITAAQGRSLDSVNDLRRVLVHGDRSGAELRVIRHGRGRTLTLRYR